jgi:hypothetical protein
VAPVLFRVVPPLLDVHVAVKFVIGLFASDVERKATVTALVLRVMPEMLGGRGVAAATKSSDGSDSAPSPIALLAKIVQEYVLPLVK